jgi:hypothetical protein
MPFESRTLCGADAATLSIMEQVRQLTPTKKGLAPTRTISACHQKAAGFARRLGPEVPRREIGGACSFFIIRGDTRLVDDGPILVGRSEIRLRCLLMQTQDRAVAER